MLLSSCFSSCSRDSLFSSLSTNSRPAKISLTQYETNTFSSELKQAQILNEIFIIESKEHCILAHIKESCLDTPKAKRRDLTLGLCLLYDPLKGKSLILNEVFYKKA